VYVVENIEEQLQNPETIEVKNVGKPVNSSADDFAYFENIEAEHAYFSSNREGGKGSDDIYFFRFPEECSQSITGTIKDTDSNELIPDATVIILDADGNPVGKVTSGTMSPSLGKGIGLGYVMVSHASPGSTVYIQIRKNRLPATVVKTPFYKG